MAGAPAITFIVSALGYALMLCAGPYWLDSGELAAASFELGIAHAPGQPLALLLGKLFCFLPLGDVAFRVGLGQLACGAGAAATVAWLGRRMARDLVDDGVTQEALGVAAGLLYAGSYAALFQAIRPEVYALSALLVLWTIAACQCFLDTRDPRHLGRAGLCFGLGLCNHHYLTLLGVTPAAIAILAGRPDVALWQGLRRGAIGTAAALLLYAYLPLRAAHDPIVDWGHPSTASSLWWVVSAQSFQKSAALTPRGDALALVAALFSQLTPAWPVFALGGLYLCARRDRRRAAWLACALLGPIGARLLVAFDPGNPDAYGYLSTAIAALALAGMIVPSAILGALPLRLRRPLGALGVVAAAALGLARAPAYSLAHVDDVRPLYTDLLAELPTGAVVVPSYFQTTFSLDYLRVVEGMRPDLVYLPRHFLDQPGIAAALLRRDPRLGPFVRDGKLNPDALLGSGRPLFVEYDLDLSPRLVPISAEIAIGHLPTEAQGRRFALWQSYLGWHRLCRLGAPAIELKRAELMLRRRAGPQGAADADSLAAGCASLRGR